MFFYDQRSDEANMTDPISFNVSMGERKKNIESKFFVSEFIFDGKKLKRNNLCFFRTIL